MYVIQIVIEIYRFLSKKTLKWKNIQEHKIPFEHEPISTFKLIPKGPKDIGQIAVGSKDYLHIFDIDLKRTVFTVDKDTWAPPLDY